MWYARISCEGRMLGQWLGTLTPIPDARQTPAAGSGEWTSYGSKCELYPEKSSSHKQVSYFTPLGLTPTAVRWSPVRVWPTCLAQGPSRPVSSSFHPHLFLSFFHSLSHHSPLPSTDCWLPHPTCLLLQGWVLFSQLSPFKYFSSRIWCPALWRPQPRQPLERLRSETLRPPSTT